MSKEKFKLPEATLFSIGATKRLINATETAHDLAMLKGAAILYPRLVLNTLAGPFDSIYKFVSSGLNGKQKAELRQILRPLPEHEARRPYSNTELLDEIIRTVGVNRQEIVKRFLNLERIAGSNPLKNPYKGEAISGDPDPLFMLYLPKRLKLPYYDSFTAGMEVNKLLHQVEFNVGKDKELSTGLPKLEKLPWDAVLELRKSTYIDSFREFLFTSIEDSQGLAEKIDKGLWEVLGMTAPSPSGEVVHRVLASLPIPVLSINPYAIYRDTKDALKQRNMFNKYGWLFFIQEARTKNNESPEGGSA